MTERKMNTPLRNRILLARTFFMLASPFFTIAPVNAQNVPATDAKAVQEVNIYTNREPALFANTLSDFTAKTGIKVNTIFSDKGLTERIVAEGKASPADVLITVDIGRLQDAVDKNIAASFVTKELEAIVPASLREKEGRWVSLSLRARAIYASVERVKEPGLTYENLADPRWKGRVCIRSGQHPYNIALIAAMIAKKGEAATKAWLTGLKANLARKPSGGDRDVAKDIAANVCDVGFGNQYYVGLMRTGSDENQKKWEQAIRVILPTFEGGGTHVNVSGAVILQNAPNKANALKLVEHMLSPETQRVFSNANFEYPVRAGVNINPIVASFGALTPDTINVTDIAKMRTRASQLVDEVGFDQ
jgi:iron(III) transport system substrate-binding protein